MKPGAVASLKEYAARATAAYAETASAIERAMRSPEAAILKERAIKAVSVTLIFLERAINAVEAAIVRERVMKAITITIALLIIAIALPAIY